MIIVYILLIIMLLCIILNIIFHLCVIFYDEATEMVVEKVLENPYKYVRSEELCYFFRNMLVLLFTSLLLYCACNGTFKYDTMTKSLEISNTK